ncbi:MAG: cytochrome c, partial [Phycisphaerae bacterium]|nr:cytochrome c [Gemmatimonadaceae bacterium]
MSRWIRRIGYVLGTLVVLIVVLAGFVAFKSGSIVSQKYAVAAEPITVVSDSAALARGQHLVEAVTKCTDCHGDDWGGKEFINDPAFMQLNASNLTRGEGGVASQYTDEQLTTLIRHGVKPDSTSVIIMPSDAYQDLSDSDVAAIVAYMRAQPPVNRTLSKPVLGPVAKALTTFGQLP